MNGLPVKGYIYRGTKRGTQDPWNTPEPPRAQPKPRTPRQTKPRKPPKPLEPCGTRAAHKRHHDRGETPCEPCMEAYRAYNRNWRAGRTPSAEQKAAQKEADRLRWLRKKAA